MRDREQLIAFEMNYCQHYQPEPRRDNWCTQGRDYIEIRKACAADLGLPPPWFKPCIGGHELTDVHAACPDWIRRTREMGEARADGLAEATRRMTLIGPVVKAWRTWSKKNRVAKDEIIECPACKGRLHLSQARYNGHVAGTCETPGCARWIE